MTDDDGYTGPASVSIGDETIEVSVRLAGAFDPISGRYRWYGRVSAARDLAPFAGSSATLHTPHAAVETTLADLDPWGRARVEGFGAAPFEVLDHLP
jgi:hypothetical protein